MTELFTYNEYCKLISQATYAFDRDLVRQLGWSLRTFEDEDVLRAWDLTICQPNDQLLAEIPGIIGHMDNPTRSWIAENFQDEGFSKPIHDFEVGSLVVFKPFISMWTTRRFYMDPDLHHQRQQEYSDGRGIVDERFFDEEPVEIWYPSVTWRSKVKTKLSHFTNKFQRYWEWAKGDEKARLKDEGARNNEIEDLLCPRRKSDDKLYESWLPSPPQDQRRKLHPMNNTFFDPTTLLYQYGIVMDQQHLGYPTGKVLDKYDGVVDNLEGQLVFQVFFGDYGNIWCPQSYCQIRPVEYDNIDEIPEALSFWTDATRRKL